MDNVIPLPAASQYCICGPYEGHIFIKGYQLLDEADSICFMLEIKTLKIERVCRMRVPTIHVGKEDIKWLTGVSCVGMWLPPLVPCCCWCGAVELHDDDAEAFCITLQLDVSRYCPLSILSTLSMFKLCICTKTVKTQCFPSALCCWMFSSVAF
ncbi:hypothetical protein BS78_05G064000 [Paspalum vaginatum]|uniref:Uncharacterized protein n=1 Tax=Paspalum vaginatum TaxID=158149 RepID=A0A9W8CD91_9POAL|nr:hypothetical protein BS78_K058500 [Paspalum vaginatum]KAJ1274471.1 hypothetical protein BS78_05G064000 [Paspalum vaginatum]